jgi:hypothetical protein
MMKQVNENIFCQLRTDDERWHRQLDFGSKLTCFTIMYYDGIVFYLINIEVMVEAIDSL